MSSNLDCVGSLLNPAADVILEAIQIQVFFSKLSNTWAVRSLALIADLHTMAAVILQRDSVAAALAESTPELDPSPFIDTPSQASRVTSTSEEVLCLILSLLITALTANKKKVSDWLATIGGSCEAVNGDRG